MKNSYELVRGKAIAALVAVRSSEFYIISVYLHPDQVKQDLSGLFHLPRKVYWGEITQLIRITFPS